jgi:hypothetical protein
LHTLICSTKKEEIRVRPLLEEALARDSKSRNNIPEDKVNQFIRRVDAEYPNPDFLNFDFLLDGENRLIGDIMNDIRKQRRLSNGLDDLKKLKGKFEKFGFHKIRHQLTAHKNKFLASPGGHSRLYLNVKLIERLGEIMKELKIGTHFWFDYALSNPLLYILDSYDELTANQK